MSALTIELNTPAIQGTSHGMEYSRIAYTDPAGIVTAAMRNLAGVQFDTFVCRGISGILVAPLLARAMSKNFLIVRKPDESCHSCSRVEGTFGHRWIFVDDFIASGNTARKCREAVHEWVINGRDAIHVGTYEYSACSSGETAAERGRFTPYSYDGSAP